WYLPFGHREPSRDLFAAPMNAEPARATVKNLPPITSPQCAPLRQLLEDAAQVLRNAGVEVQGLRYDSMLASFVLDPSRRSHGIDSLALECLGQRMTQYTDLTGKGKTQIPFAEVDVELAALYCGADSATVLALRDHFAGDLERHRLVPLLEQIEMP